MTPLHIQLGGRDERGPSSATAPGIGVGVSGVGNPIGVASFPAGVGPKYRCPVFSKVEMSAFLFQSGFVIQGRQTLWTAQGAVHRTRDLSGLS